VVVYEMPTTIIECGKIILGLLIIESHKYSVQRSNFLSSPSVPQLMLGSTPISFPTVDAGLEHSLSPSSFKI